ncbi:hypothetical protein SSYM_2242 [Serratia symbiotica str. Tucson]|uniref:Uncharacterized protein n=1 Tax=Serratia symbiotica str. Tucson TaxID=914128 RepID=E9CP20_9GAMM|nr:hypothetical protein SSYM_2242 [Serratia symbiotica str. Tucson]
MVQKRQQYLIMETNQLMSLAGIRTQVRVNMVIMFILTHSQQMVQVVVNINIVRMVQEITPILFGLVGIHTG